MIGPSGTVRVMVATKPVDFRKGAPLSETAIDIIQKIALFGKLDEPVCHFIVHGLISGG